MSKSREEDPREHMATTQSSSVTGTEGEEVQSKGPGDETSEARPRDVTGGWQPIFSGVTPAFGQKGAEVSEPEDHYTVEGSTGNAEPEADQVEMREQIVSPLERRGHGE